MLLEEKVGVAAEAKNNPQLNLKLNIKIKINKTKDNRNLNSTDDTICPHSLPLT